MPDLSWLGGKLAPRSERVLEAAVLISERHGHRFLGVEHLAGGLLEVAPDASRQAADASGVLLSELRQEVEKMLACRWSPDWAEPLRITPRLSDVLTIALDECKRDAATQITPAHMWRAICREGGSVPAQLALGHRRAPTTQVDHAAGATSGGKLPPILVGQLQDWCYDLTALAENGKLSPVLGRDDLIERLVRILLIPEGPANPILTGPAGVGKSALVEGLAMKLLDPGTVRIPDRLRNCRVFALSMTSIISGQIFRGPVEERLRQVVRFFSENRDRAILFIDEIHLLAKFGLGDTLLEPLARGRLRLIGATTTAQFAQFIREDEALTRRFTQVEVNEPDLETVASILRSLQNRHVAECGVRIGDAAISKAIELAPRYMRSQHLPHKAKQWLELSVPLAELDGRAEVNARDVMRVVADQAGIPANVIAHASGRGERFGDVLRRRILGQDHVIAALEDWAKVALGPLPRRHPTAPTGVFLFLGPTGVGKTETAKALAHFLFGDEERMIRLDMSEFQDGVAYQRLIGFGRGIVGAERGGLLTEAVKCTPYTLLLLDEIDKAHESTRRLFLSILDEGRVTSGLGETVYFSDTVIVMTSNQGSDHFFPSEDTGSIGFPDEMQQAMTSETKRESVLTRIRDTLLAPEFANRIDLMLVFDPLSRDSAIRIARLLVEKLNRRVGPDGKSVDVTDDALEAVVDAGFDAKYGARSLQRVFERMVTAPLAEKYERGTHFQVVACGGEIEVRSDEEQHRGPAAPAAEEG